MEDTLGHRAHSLEILESWDHKNPVHMAHSLENQDHMAHSPENQDHMARHNNLDCTGRTAAAASLDKGLGPKNVLFFQIIATN